MSDWIGLAFFILLMFGALVGLKILAKPRKTTSEEFERNAAESTSILGTSMNALHNLMGSGESQAKEIRTQLKERRFNKKEYEEKAINDTNTSEVGNGK